MNDIIAQALQILNPPPFPSYQFGDKQENSEWSVLADRLEEYGIFANGKGFLSEMRRQEAAQRIVKILQKRLNRWPNSQPGSPTALKVKDRWALYYAKKIVNANQKQLKESQIIDLTPQQQSNNNLQQEGVLRMFGSWIQTILKAMFGGYSIPLTLRGKKSEIEAFVEALAQEKRYMEAMKKFGLDRPNSYRDKLELEKAISKFERATNLRWPIKP